VQPDGPGAGGDANASSAAGRLEVPSSTGRSSGSARSATSQTLDCAASIAHEALAFRPALLPSLLNQELIDLLSTLHRDNLRLGGAVPSLSELLSQPVLVF